jgi:hypothetical protein
MKTKLTASDFLSEIRQYLDAKYGENYIFSPTMIDPTTLGVQMAIMENTNHGVERKFDLVIKDIVEPIYDSNDEKLNISDVSVSDLFGNCDYCKNKRYIGVYGKPCVVPEPCLYETGKKNWEHNGKFPNHSH